jgi:hypothetical protein
MAAVDKGGLVKLGSFPCDRLSPEDFLAQWLTLGYFLVRGRVDYGSRNRIRFALDLSRFQQGLILG